MATKFSDKLSKHQKQIVRQFASLQKTDYVKVGNHATIGSVLEAIDSKDQKDEGILLKYQLKLAEAAQKQGFSSVEAMMEDRKAKQVKETNGLKEEQKEEKNYLPTHVKTLNEIVKLDLLLKESKEIIAKIWNTYYSTRNSISACLDSAFYQKLSERGKKFPMFVLPHPRDDGYELFLLQFQGHQIFFTPLIEYQTHRENARVCFTVTFYTDLAIEKDVVLLLGELSDQKANLKDLQNLIYQLQLFYVTGNDTQKSLVETFWNNPAEFDYKKLLFSFSGSENK